VFIRVTFGCDKKFHRIVNSAFLVYNLSQKALKLLSQPSLGKKAKVSRTSREFPLLNKTV